MTEETDRPINQTRRGKATISVPELRVLLGLPDDVEITGIQKQQFIDVVVVEYRGPRVPLVDAWTEPRATHIEVFYVEGNPTPQTSVDLRLEESDV